MIQFSKSKGLFDHGREQEVRVITLIRPSGAQVNKTLLTANIAKMKASMPAGTVVLAREQQIGGSGGSLEPPGPLLKPLGPLLTLLFLLRLLLFLVT